MARRATKVVPFARPVPLVSVCVGEIVAVTPDGGILVDFEQNPASPIAARALLGHEDALLDAAERRSPVLLFFEGGDPGLPVVVGRLTDLPLAPESWRTSRSAGHLHNLTFDGSTFTVKAGEALTLSCGKASVTLHADGTVLIRGSHIVSRSSGLNKIRGAAVKIN